MTAESIIQLTGMAPAGSGSAHHVYEHPGDPECLIKLPQAHTSNAKFRFYQRRHMTTSLQAEKNQHRITGRLPVALYRGQVKTDLGPAYLVERIAEDTGALASNCEQFRQAGTTLPPDVLNALNTYVDKLQTLGLVCADLTLRNLAIRRSDKGVLEVIQIDGLGDRVIPLRVWVPAVNRLRTGRRLMKIARNIGLDWTGRGFA